MTRQSAITTVLILFPAFFALPAQAWWGKYGSQREAYQACKEWKSNGKRIGVINNELNRKKADRLYEELWTNHDFKNEIPGRLYDHIYRADAINSSYEDVVRYENLRRCQWEKSTRQFLGEVYTGNVDTSIVYEKSPIKKHEYWKVRKRFRY